MKNEKSKYPMICATFIVREFDKYGNTICEKTVEGKKVSISESEFYDNGQRKKNSMTETNNGEQTSYYMYEYNESGDTITYISKNRWSEEERHTEYDKNGFVSKESYYELYGDDDVEQWSKAYEHDDKGKLTKEIVYGRGRQVFEENPYL